MDGLNLGLKIGKVEREVGMGMVESLEVFSERDYLSDHMWGAGETFLYSQTFKECMRLMWGSSWRLKMGSTSAWVSQGDSDSLLSVQSAHPSFFHPFLILV